MTINITIQSANLKDIEFIRLTDFSQVLSVGNNATASLPYDNYILQFTGNLSSISGSSLLTNIDGSMKDLALWLIVGVIFTVCAGMLHYYTKNKR